jgi:hypothetical protein
MGAQMLKEVVEIVKALLEFFRSLKVVLTIFICSVVWLSPHVRNLLPVPKPYTENANFVASIALLLSGVYLVVSVFELLYQRVQKWRRSEGRRFRKALARATPLEKLVLEAVIRIGENLIKLDVGSDIAMHLLEVGLIEQEYGPNYTTYRLDDGLADLCIRNPSLLHILPQQQKVAAELEKWRKDGLHQGFFNQFDEPSDNSWMRL